MSIKEQVRRGALIMKVYILTNTVKWEGSTIYGVFATQAAAEKEMEEKQYTDETGYSWFTISAEEVKE